jgi:hypothetical protein
MELLQALAKHPCHFHPVLNQETIMGIAPLPSETALTPESESQEQTSFDVRLSKYERKVLDNLHKDFAESLVNIFTKSLRLYQATIDAADQGGNLVMVSTSAKGGLPEPLSNTCDTQAWATHIGSKNNSVLINSPATFTSPIHQRLDKSTSMYHSNNGQLLKIEHPSKTQTLQDVGTNNSFVNQSFVLTTSTLLKPDGFTDAFQERTFIPVNPPDQSQNFAEALIAARDPFADYSTTPIIFNSKYIPVSKGAKVERVTLKADSTYMNRLRELEQRTGLKKSAIIRDSLQLYDFIKRNFNKNGITFYIGGRSIGVI